MPSTFKKDGDGHFCDDAQPQSSLDSSNSCPTSAAVMLGEPQSSNTAPSGRFSSWAEGSLNNDAPRPSKRLKVDLLQPRYDSHHETLAAPAVQAEWIQGGTMSQPTRRSGRLFIRIPGKKVRDLVTFLSDDKNLAPDDLLNLPPRSLDYVSLVTRENNANERAEERAAKNWIPHPSLKKRHEDGTATPSLYRYYEKLQHDERWPIAGIIRDEDTDSKLQEDGFHARPSIKLMMPDHLKAILVDDWENVTKNQQLVPLPSPHPVNSILADYLVYEKPKRQPGSAEADLLEEVIAGLKQYFDKSLGRILLYRFERSQYLEVIQGWEDKDSPLYGKTIGDTYGAEHLCRLLVSLPELIAQTNMDQPSVNRLREELTKLTNWLGKHAVEYFASEYETPNQSYIEKARA